MKSKYGDPRTLTFSQTYGYEEMPQRLKLGELSGVARTKIWDVLFVRIKREWTSMRFTDRHWENILRAVHLDLDNLPLDQWDYERCAERLRQSIMTWPFNKVFDLVQFILRHPQCPADLVKEMKGAFEMGMVAYVIHDNGTPTIFPASTVEEGRSLNESLHTLQQGGLSAAEDLFRKAASAINRGDWTGSIDSSISAAESVARKLYPKTKTFGDALKKLRRESPFWPPQLVQAMQNFWNYTNQKDAGIRHGSPEPTDTNVGQEEALFMLGACASISGYLWRKNNSADSNEGT
ncbi:MAG: hypothetical protein OXT71_02550 [Acidobacteriota bacterium]|nr:hypothetical protein [Acidobacteriota bacterium]